MHMRDYLRHPSDIPLDVHPLDNQNADTQQLRDVSFGGISFVSRQRVATGSVLRIRITLVTPPFETEGVVVWCRHRFGKYLVGLKFTQAGDIYQARMVEQICHIEHYRKQVLHNEGRKLSSQEAAREWIAQYAAGFPHPEQKAP